MDVIALCLLQSYYGESTISEKQSTNKDNRMMAMTYRNFEGNENNWAKLKAGETLVPKRISTLFHTYYEAQSSLTLDHEVWY